ncbi:EAL domain-containing protein, partial [Pseudomonas aeruginosa]|nr:EAL domain-containing protein [Pseudomonas aeruginosa]
ARARRASRKASAQRSARRSGALTPSELSRASCSVEALAQALGISLVVEGVESDEQRVRLIELGCSIAQGYLFARPMPEQHFLDYCSGS